MEETTSNEELKHESASKVDDAEPDEITEEEMQRSLEKLFPRYEQMLRNLAE